MKGGQRVGRSVVGTVEGPRGGVAKGGKEGVLVNVGRKGKDGEEAEEGEGTEGEEGEGE